MIPRAAIPISNEELFFSLLTTVTRSKENEVNKFEKDLANYLGVRKVYGVNSGRTALYLALKSLGLKPQTGVIVPAYVCPIVFEVILRSNLKPILVDVDPKTYNINPELILNAITSEVKVIILVHLFGRPCEMDQIIEMASKYNLFIIEDVAQALGAEYKRLKTGTFGDIAIFSLGPGKSITSGEGGALAINNSELIDKVRENRTSLPDPDLYWDLHVIKNIVAMKLFSNYYFYALIRDYLEENLKKIDQEIVLNCIWLMSKAKKSNLFSTIKIAKMSPLSAEMARIQLKKIDELNQKRIENARILTDLLSDMNYKFVSLPETHEKIKNVFSRYPVKLPKSAREHVVKGMLRQGADTEKPYSYLKPFLQRYSDVTCAKDLCDTILTIPNHPLLKEKDLQHLSEAFKSSIRECKISS
jgi:perosamine synthetase